MKRGWLVALGFVSIIISIIAFSYAKNEPLVDINSKSYSYLPEEAKNFILTEASKGKKVLTEKNREEGKLYLNPKYVEYLALPDSSKSALETIPETYTWDFKPSEIISGSNPSYFNLRDDGNSSSVKNQSTLGLCWAFAIYSSIESNILVSNLSEREVTFAERQLDYLISDNSIIGITNPYSITNHNLGDSGNFSMATAYLNSGVAPIESSIWGPYETSSNQRTIKETINSANVTYQVTGYNIYGSANYSSETVKENYRNALKNHVQNYGSLYVSTIPPSTLTGCYDYNLNLINDTDDCDYSVGFHAMSIIGWDDNYEGGAWILKNSWGNSIPYTYLSYDSVYYDVNGVTSTKYRNWDNIYDYTKERTTESVGNTDIYTYVKSPDFAEELTRIVFTHESSNGEYKVYVKKSPADQYTLLETVKTTYPGMSSIDVSNVDLTGNSFSIKIVTIKGSIGMEVNAFTANKSSEQFSSDYEATYNGNSITKTFFFRNIESGTNLPLHIYSELGQEFGNSSVNVINGQTGATVYFPASTPNGKYYLTFNEDFFNVNLTKKIVELDINDAKTYQLTYDIDSRLTVSSLVFTSQNSEIASVDNTGLITANQIGKTKVTMNLNNCITKEVTVIVGPIVEVTNIDIVEESQTIYRNVFNDLNLHANVYPSDAIYDGITWVSSNPSIATVNADGLVVSLTAGTVTITASAGDYSDQITLNIINTSSLTIDKTEATLYLNGINTTLVTPTKKSPIPQRYTWISSDDSIATVTDGLITGVSNGIARIIVATSQNRYAAGLIVYVVDEEVLFDLDIDPNGGTYKDLTTYKYSKNSLTSIDLDIPVYKTNIELVYNVENEENGNLAIDNTFLNWTLSGAGTLNGNNYKFGFANASIKASWTRGTVILPDISELNPTRHFVGWYKDQLLTEFIGKNVSFASDRNTTIYAKWDDFMRADVNNDSVVDITDLVILRKHLAGITELTGVNLDAADVNNDTFVDITDLVILRRYLAGLEELN